MTVQVLDIRVVAPRLTTRAVEVSKRRRQNGLELLPRPVAERFDEPDVQVAKGFDVLHGCASLGKSDAPMLSPLFPRGLVGCGQAAQSRLSRTIRSVPRDDASGSVRKHRCSAL